jgi:hypothetical protein
VQAPPRTGFVRAGHGTMRPRVSQREAKKNFWRKVARTA